MKRVVVSGATGMIGPPLVRALIDRGDRVTVWCRDEARARAALGDAITAVAATYETPGPWLEAARGADAIVHLAGEPIAGGRWDARRKQAIRDSRVESTRVIVEALAAWPAAERPRALITASGADYYPFADRAMDDDDEITEAAPAGGAFLARVCKAWETEAANAEAAGVRVVRMRTGVVIGRGGALAKMTTPFKLFAGGRIGSGDQWFAWIHADDAVAAYVAAIDDDRYRGPINLVAPGIVRNRELAKALGAALGRPAWLPVPAFAIKAAVGELAEYLLEGRRVVPAALQRLGFAFRHPDLAGALRASLDR
ncbi:MAG: TIGR01777 family oxidoreductase [Myxococcales bacterium]|nr:TIGR01777 family oxidoreductase [Myxococcales bacterium]